MCIKGFFYPLSHDCHSGTDRDVSTAYCRFSGLRGCLRSDNTAADRCHGGPLREHFSSPDNAGRQCLGTKPTNHEQAEFVIHQSLTTMVAHKKLYSYSVNRLYRLMKTCWSARSKRGDQYLRNSRETNDKRNPLYFIIVYEMQTKIPSANTFGAGKGVRFGYVLLREVKKCGGSKSLWPRLTALTIRVLA